MAPLAAAMREGGLIEPVIVATGQHPDMVGQSLAAFGRSADITLSIERRTGEQAELVSQLCSSLDAAIGGDRSAGVVVQGDTASALAGGLVAFWRRTPLVHLEAGLRSGDLRAPFPEEANRRMIGVVADLHLAPTRRAADALIREHVDPERVHVVGNTVVDAVLAMAAADLPFEERRLVEVERLAMTGEARLAIVTAHRRESWGSPLASVLSAVLQIVEEHLDLRCVLPAHPNPAVRSMVERALGRHDRITITGPLAYPDMCRLLARSCLVISDSGGIQEEAPSFRVPVLVLRDVTERTEAVDGGWAELVGTDSARIVAAAKEVLSGDRTMPDTGNPFGDGRAAQRGAQAIAWLLGLASRPPEFCVPAPSTQ